MYYDKKGNEISTMEFCKLFENAEYKILKKDKLSNGDVVSTVWLGIDHSFVINEPHTPLIFETMLFSDNEEYDNDYERYSTE